jgi:DNA (cytosine-5)-methyltransferase 1
LLGWSTVCAVENEPYARDVLMARQNDGCLEAFPIWDDVRTFDGRPWQGIVDVVSGGFPCQDISAAGKGEGIEGERSGLWNEFARIIGEVQPSFVFVENSPMLASRGIGTVLGDLAALGFDAEWGVLGAHHSGAPHKRDRIWIVGVSNTNDCSARRFDSRSGSKIQKEESQRIFSRSDEREDVADTDRAQRERVQRAERIESEHADACSPSWWKFEPDVGRVADGVAARVDRLRCIGNGQVPAVAALAWHTLIERFNENR